MNRLAICVGVALSAAVAVPAAAAQMASAQAVLARMRKNLPPTLRVEQVQFTSTDRSGGKRTLRGTLYARRQHGLLRAMLHIDAPPDLAGASYLLRETDNGQEMYLFLPAINRVRPSTAPAATALCWAPI